MWTHFKWKTHPPSSQAELCLKTVITYLTQENFSREFVPACGEEEGMGKMKGWCVSPPLGRRDGIQVNEVGGSMWTNQRSGKHLWIEPRMARMEAASCWRQGLLLRRHWSHITAWTCTARNKQNPTRNDSSGSHLWAFWRILFHGKMVDGNWNAKGWRDVQISIFLLKAKRRRGPSDSLWLRPLISKTDQRHWHVTWTYF